MIRSTLAFWLVALVFPGCGDDVRRPLVPPATGSITGQVLSVEGTRVATARLILSSGEVAFATETDAGGVYAFGGVVTQVWNLELEPPTGWLASDGQMLRRSVNVLENVEVREDFVVMRVP